MTDSALPSLDIDLIELINEGQGVLSEVERLHTARELHRCGLDLLAQGYSAQAELCFRVARHAALAENQNVLAMLASIDLARSLNERNPRLALSVLGHLAVADIEKSILSTYYNALGQAVGSLCRYDIADRCYLASLTAASECKDPIRMAIAMANRSTLIFYLGAIAESRRLNEEAAAMLNDSDQQGNLGLLVMNMASNAMHEGNYDEAGDLFERLDQLCSHTRNVKVSAFGLVNRGELELLSGNHDMAHELFRHAERHAATASLPTIQVQALVLRNLVEDTLDPDSLLEATAASARDLSARELMNESIPMVALSASLAALHNQAVAPYLSILDSTARSLHLTRMLMDHYRRLLEVLEARRQTHGPQCLPKFVTNAPSVISIKEKLDRLVDSDVRILIEGETGTGKSFLARQIHDAARRVRSSFVVVDCTNLEENLFESKLFGHRRGSFTGAISDMVGLVEQANDGTLFLDEIGEVPREIQGKLLYTIEEQRYRPVGAKQERHSNFRVIAATNRDIDRMLDDGTLRRDLFFRLAGFRVLLPPLRERREDIVPLATLRLNQLNEKYARRKTFRSGVWDLLVQLHWPGNVRELNTTIERGYHLSTGRRIAVDDLGIGLASNSRTPDDLRWYSIRREHLVRVLRLCRGNVTKAAQMLGLNRTTLIYKLKLLDIERKDYVGTMT